MSAPPFSCATRVIQTDDWVEQLAGWLGPRCWVLVTSAGWQARGAVERLVSRCVPPVAVVADVLPNPTVEQVISQARALPEAEAVVALGGGSVIDAAKAIAALRGMGCNVGALYAHLREGRSLPIRLYPAPIVAIPTTAGTGSEVTAWGTLWDGDEKRSINDRRLLPELALLDPSLALTMPRALTLSSGLDALSHALEAIWNRRHAPLTDALAAQAIAALRRDLGPALERGDDLGLRRSLQTAALLAGLAMGTTQTALAHSISYPFTARFGVPHGLACSFTLPEVARFNAGSSPERMVPIAGALGCEPEAVPDALGEWLDGLGVGGAVAAALPADALETLGDALITPARAANNVRPADACEARRIVRAALERAARCEEGLASGPRRIA